MNIETKALQAKHRAESQQRLLDFMQIGTGIIARQNMQFAPIVLNTSLTNREVLDLMGGICWDL